MKLAWIGFEAVTCVFLLRIFKLLDLKPERVLIYAWHPLCLWEIASSGHIDAAAITFLTLAIYTRLKNQPGATGAWLGSRNPNQALPRSALPAFFQKGKWRMPAIFAAIVAIGYACYSSVGFGVFGYLPGYAQEEGLDSGTRFFLLTLANRTLHTAIPMRSLHRILRRHHGRDLHLGPPSRKPALRLHPLRTRHCDHIECLLLAPLSVVLPLAAALSRDSSLAAGLLSRRRQHLSLRNQPRSTRRADVPSQHPALLRLRLHARL